jgi:hypothetical protein
MRKAQKMKTSISQLAVFEFHRKPFGFIEKQIVRPEGAYNLASKNICDIAIPLVFSSV